MRTVRPVRPLCRSRPITLIATITTIATAHVDGVRLKSLLVLTKYRNPHCCKIKITTPITTARTSVRNCGIAATAAPAALLLLLLPRHSRITATHRTRSNRSTHRTRSILDAAVGVALVSIIRTI
jgi:hypothetical protein